MTTDRRLLWRECKYIDVNDGDDVAELIKELQEKSEGFDRVTVQLLEYEDDQISLQCLSYETDEERERREIREMREAEQRVLHEQQWEAENERRERETYLRLRAKFGDLPVDDEKERET